MDVKQQVSQQRVRLEVAVRKALDIALASAHACEVAITKSTGFSVTTRMCEVESIEFNSDGVLGITVYRDQRKGSASTSDLSEKAIQQAIVAALDISRYTSEDPYAGLAPRELMIQSVPDLHLFYPDMPKLDYAAQIAIAAERKALSYTKIKQSDGASYDSRYAVKVYGNSHGLLASYSSSRHSISCCVIGQGKNNRMERDYSYTVARDCNELWTPETVGQQAAEKTISRLDSKKLTTGKYPVMFSSDVATSLIGHLIIAISGVNLYRKSSFLLDCLGQQILPKWFNIVERPHVLGGLASAPFDDEGIFTQDRQIIADGILTTYLLTSYAARKMSMIPTGHAGGVHNWFVKSTGQNFEMMLRELNTGLLVTEIMGQGINVVTGDYSRGAAGFWVENGEIKYPVSEVTIASNLKDMFMNIVAVGKDTEVRSQVQTGSILLESMKVAGD
ncbi:protein pmbA [Candidatus Photodesmus blepharus]|uniref:Protein pmbA n=1 Tax=Candidatus Photodesmus blepharonis TaxID=1179155 RepID=A0A084CM48_9GAMM|nr:metalloprotease PmbA [Candidatus Photodesmus blepharus]KEY90877.1 protein pmbA [Candidatus Photodesmus blepharus]